MVRSAGWPPISWLYARTLHQLGPGRLQAHARACHVRLARQRACRSSCSRPPGAKTGAERTSPVVALPGGDRQGDRDRLELRPAAQSGLVLQPARRPACDDRFRRRHAPDGRRASSEGEERERQYSRGIEIYPGWTQYRTRAAHRRDSGHRVDARELRARAGHVSSVRYRQLDRAVLGIAQRALWATSQGVARPGR